MSSMGWIGVILWGVFMTGIGLLGLSPTPDTPGALQDQTVVALISIGLVTCLIGALGVCGMLSWIPGLRDEQKTVL